MTAAQFFVPGVFESDESALRRARAVPSFCFRVISEQLQGAPVQPAWDIWALSIIAYELLTGVHPIKEKKFSTFLSAILAGDFAPVTAHVAGAPQAWQAFFDVALSGDPTCRPHPRLSGSLNCSTSARLLYSNSTRRADDFIQEFYCSFSKT